MANKAKESISSKQIVDGITSAEIDELTDAETDEFLELFGPKDPEPAAAEATPELEPARELVGAGAELSNASHGDIELANAAAASANANAREALRRMAAAEFAAYRRDQEAAGVPPHLLDLAAPILGRPDSVVIDLSNTGDADVDVTAVVRGLVEASRGLIDIDLTNGHGGSDSGDASKADEALAAWESQYPTGKPIH